MAPRKDIEELRERVGTFEAPIGSVQLPSTGVRYDKRGNPKPLQSGQDEHPEPGERAPRQKRQPDPELAFTTDLFVGDPRERAALATCAKVLSSKLLTERQLRDKLVAAQHEPDMVDFAVERCRESGLVDDAAYATSWVESRIRRGHGVRRIKQDLAQRGVPREVVEAALAAEAPGDELDVAAVDAARKKAARLDLSDAASRAKLQRWLAGRGFTSHQVNAAVRAIQEEQATTAD